MQDSLALTALLMGLVGGPHCVLMCGAACAGLASAAGDRRRSALWLFHLGRMAGYSAMGALAATSVQSIGWLTTRSAAIRPVWTLVHVAAAGLGLALLISARQPAWLEGAGKALWVRARTWVGAARRPAPLIVGTVWALLPCGLLYSAILVAAMSARAAEGAAIMALFALGTSVSMVAGPWLWLRLRAGPAGQVGVRMAGLALAASSSWVVWAGLVRGLAPWCLAP